MPSRNGPLGLRSGDWLQMRLKRHFGKRPFVYYDPLFPRWRHKFARLANQGEPFDVILVGRPHIRLIELAAMEFDRIRLHVLSRAGRSVLVELMGVPASAVETVPRFTLASPKLSGGIDPRERDLIFAGRLATGKGVLHLLQVVSVLQTEFWLPYRLHICGSFDEMVPHNFWGRRFSNRALKEEFTQLLRCLRWTQPPEIHTDLGPNAWLNFGFKNPALISLSQHSHEDFAVSVAQAQEAGWPTILSAWGAHFDAELANTLLLRTKYDVFSTASQRIKESRALAHEILRVVDSGRFVVKPRVDEPRGRSHKSITSLELRRILGGAFRRHPGLFFPERGKIAPSNHLQLAESSLRTHLSRG